MTRPKTICHHVTKQLLDSEVLRFRHEHLHEESMNRESLSFFAYDLKISLNREEIVPDKKIPVIVEKTEWVRIKSRKSFEYKPSHAKMPLWRFDISMTWSDKTISAAERRRHDKPPVYEIECELLNVDYFLNEMESNDMQAAFTMLLKILDLFGTERDHVYFE